VNEKTDAHDVRLRREEQDFATDQIKSRNRVRVVGLLLVALFLLLMAFLRYGKTVPWAAR